MSLEFRQPTPELLIEDFSLSLQALKASGRLSPNVSDGDGGSGGEPANKTENFTEAQIISLATSGYKVLSKIEVIYDSSINGVMIVFTGTKNSRIYGNNARFEVRYVTSTDPNSKINPKTYLAHLPQI